jgi:hypothetical protein
MNIESTFQTRKSEQPTFRSTKSVEILWPLDALAARFNALSG